MVFLQGNLLAAVEHDDAFWKSIREHDFAVPAGEALAPLALEIPNLASSRDSFVRDDCAYEILAHWCGNNDSLSSDDLEAMRKKLIPGMLDHLGESGNETVFRRSFSALYLSVLVAKDWKKPAFSQEAFDETLQTALRCYAEERDLRGYIPENGWAHATAHVADVLKFLARNSKLKPSDQRAIIAAIAQRCRTAGAVFAWGEDSRMAVWPWLPSPRDPISIRPTFAIGSTSLKTKIANSGMRRKSIRALTPPCAIKQIFSRILPLKSRTQTFRRRFAIL